MRAVAALVLSALLYAVFLPGANPVSAADWTADDRAALKALAKGEMSNLVIHDAPRAPLREMFRDGDGRELSLEDFAGKVVLVNFWATWCPPCRAEMPSIDRLAGAMTGPDFEVVALSTDRFDQSRIVDFFQDIDVQHLAVYQDRRGAVARQAGALGLPITILLDREGREVARVTGEAEWDAPEVKALITRMIELTAPGA